MVGTSSAQSNSMWEHLVDALDQSGKLPTARIREAFHNVPRHLFVPPSLREEADMLDAALPIGEGQTVSQPTTVAIMLEQVQPQEGDHVLDIGTGSGWQAALLSWIVGSEGHVDTVERVPALAQEAGHRFQDLGLKNVESHVGDGSRGLPEHAPFDVIVAAAESSEVPPALLEQLAPAGRLLHPISRMGLRVLRKKEDGQILRHDIPGFIFVPLVQSGEEPKTLQR